MDKLTFYNKIPEMECMSGDTLDAMEIEVDGIETLSKPSMKVQISKKGQENKILAVKNCTQTQKGFEVTIDSDDTSGLNGVYWVDFILTAGGLDYKKLRGLLVVYPQIKGA